MTRAGLWAGFRAAARRRPGLSLTLLAAATCCVELVVFTLRFPLWRDYAVPLMQFGSADLGSHNLSRFLVAGLLMFAFYGLGWLACPADADPRLALLVAGLAVACSLPLLATYPIASSDVYDYVARGHLVAVHHVNPFETVPSAFPNDPVYRYVFWRNIPADYGPVWHLQSDAIAYLTGSNLLAAVAAHKLLVCAYFWAGLPLVWFTLRTLGSPRPLQGLLLYGWNPLLQFELAGNGHNDAVAVFCLLLAVWLLVGGRRVLSLLALVAGVLVKFFPALLLPLFALAVLRDPGLSRPRKALALAAALLLGIGLTLLLYAPYGLHSIADSASRLRVRDRYLGGSIPALAVYALEDSRHLARAAALAPVAAACRLLGLAIIAWRALPLALLPFETRLELMRTTIRLAFETLFLFLVFALPWFWPWYVTWLFAFAPFLTGWRTLLAAAYSLSAFGLYLADYFLSGHFRTGTQFDSLRVEALLVTLVYVPLLALAAALLWRARAAGGPRGTGPYTRAAGASQATG